MSTSLRYFSTWRSSTRHSHASHKHNINHIGGYHAPDKSIRYVNRLFRAIPIYRNRTTNLAPRPTFTPTFTPAVNLFARAVSTKTPPVTGLGSDAPTASAVSQVDVEGWVDPEEMPSLRGTSMDDGSGNYSRRKIQGTASEYPTDSEASVSADKQDMSTQEMINHTTKRAKNKSKQTDQDLDSEQAVGDEDIASHSTQGGRRPKKAQMMSGQKSESSGKMNAGKSQQKSESSGASGKINEGKSHPASYGTNPEINKNQLKNDEWTM